MINLGEDIKLYVTSTFTTELKKRKKKTFDIREILRDDALFLNTHNFISYI